MLVRRRIHVVQIASVNWTRRAGLNGLKLTNDRHIENAKTNLKAFKENEKERKEGEARVLACSRIGLAHNCIGTHIHVTRTRRALE